MGKLLYGHSPMQIDFDDRTLAHVQLVVGTKLRRGEKFFFSWHDSLAVGSGRSSIWLEPSIPLYFKFASSKPIALNREWIDMLILSSHSSGGLQFLAEPGIPVSTALPQSRV
jgi:hypothetical protein